MTLLHKARTLLYVVLLGFVVLCACWSTTWYAIRLCLRGYPPLYGAALRFLLAALLMAGLSALWRVARRRFQAPRDASATDQGGDRGHDQGAGTRKLSARVHRALALAGLANGIGYAFIYLAEQTISGGTAAVISAANPFFTALLARCFHLERLVPRRMAGVVLGFTGVAVMMADGLKRSREHLWAMLLVAVAAAVLWPIYGVLLKRHTSQIPPLRSSAYFLFYTGLTLLIMASLSSEPFPSFRHYPLDAHLGLLYLAVVGSVVAWTVYLWLLKRLDLTVLSAVGLIQPVVALVLDFIVGDIEMRRQGYLGAALVLCGVVLAALRAAPELRTRMRLRALLPGGAARRRGRVTPLRGSREADIAGCKETAVL